VLMDGKRERDWENLNRQSSVKRIPVMESCRLVTRVRSCCLQHDSIANLRKSGVEAGAKATSPPQSFVEVLH